LREGSASKSRLRGQSDKAFMTLNRAGIALVPKETRCDANLCPSVQREQRIARSIASVIPSGLRTSNSRARRLVGAACAAMAMHGHRAPLCSMKRPTTEGLPI